MNLETISNKIAIRLCDTLKLEESLIPVYAYGLELLLAALLNILLIILIAFIFRLPYAGISFLSAFIPLRVTAGGYHAGTHFWCTVLCLIAFTISAAIANCILEVYRPVVGIAFCLFDLITVICLSPVQAVQKPLTSKEQQINRKRSLCLSVLFCGISLLGLYQRLTLPTLFFSFGVFTAALSQIAGKIQSI